MKGRFGMDPVRLSLLVAALFVPLAFGQGSARTVPGAVSSATSMGSADPIATEWPAAADT